MAPAVFRMITFRKHAHGSYDSSMTRRVGSDRAIGCNVVDGKTPSATQKKFPRRPLIVQSFTIKPTDGVMRGKPGVDA